MCLIKIHFCFTLILITKLSVNASISVTETNQAGLCDGINVGIIQHPTSCTKFIMCIFGNENGVDCPRDQVFDPSRGACADGKKLIIKD